MDSACQAYLSFTVSHRLLKLISIESVMPSNHLILCHLFLLLPSIFPSIRVFSNESDVHIRQPTYWSFSFSISPSNEYSGLISFTSFPDSSVGKEFTFNAGDPGSVPGPGRSDAEGIGYPLQYSCLEHSQGQRSPAGYSPWGHKESNTTGVCCTAQQSLGTPRFKIFFSHTT